ncbi:hypothetical protein ACI2L1_12425 [Streptomyces sp. NPDC019531]|uniref:hypothetical protein n=1 Tax=Streptomyces sp. NPDC019531 TaxID=3365062 RepID=UPI00384BD750
MLPEALTALAAAGGAAVVQAAGTDAWEGLRSQLAQWLGRGDAERERGELDRLDGSAADLADAEPGIAEQIRSRQEAVWQTRIESMLEDLGNEQRARAAAELRQLLDEAAPVPASEAGLVTGNTFNGPTAFQAGNHNQQDVHFGPQP